MAISFTLNGKPESVDVSPEMPLLWVLRDTLNKTGTKFGCGMALCGACTVHINGEATRSCITAISSIAGKKVTTIEGLSADGSHPVQQAWMEEDVPQCGYCQSGQIIDALVDLDVGDHRTGAAGVEQAVEIAKEVDRAANLRVGSAAANVATHGFVDIGISGVGGFGEQRGCSHNLPGLTIAALRNILFDPGLLHGMAAVGR